MTLHKTQQQQFFINVFICAYKTADINACLLGTVLAELRQPSSYLRSHTYMKQ
jgi:hypothetical protein